MPDGAFEATERQFLDSSRRGRGRTIEVRRYTMAGVPRGDGRRRESPGLPALRRSLLDPPDLLIITGSNPLELSIEDEPYWADLVDCCHLGA